MPSILNETMISIRAATELVPGAGAGGKVCFATVWRWIERGIRRRPDGAIVRLEAVRLGGRWVTSREAIARFCAALGQPALADVAPELCGR